LATIGISGYLAYVLEGLNLKGSQTDGAFLDKATNSYHANHDQVESQFPSHSGVLGHKGQMKDEPVSVAFAQSQLSQPSAEFTQNQLCKEKYPFQQMMDITFCVVNKESAPTIIILGTSFANHLYPGLSNSSAFSHHTILSVGRCNISEGKVGENENPANQKGPCGSNYKIQEQDWIGNIVKKSPSIKYAIISGIEADPITPIYIARLRSRIDFLQSQGLTVIVFIPHYIPYVNINDCVRMLPQGDHKCDFHRNNITAYIEKYMPLFDSIKSSNPSVYIFNQNELFCTKEDCSYMKNGGPLSWDMDKNGSGGHFSTYGSDEMAKLFAKWANKYLPEILKNP
jgi:hypothetical protein